MNWVHSGSYFLLIVLETGKEKERQQRNINVTVREKYPSVVSWSAQPGINPQHAYVPWSAWASALTELNSWPFGARDDALNNWATPTRAPGSFYLQLGIMFHLKSSKLLPLYIALYFQWFKNMTWSSNFSRWYIYVCGFLYSDCKY